MARPKKQRRRWFTDMEPADYILSAIGLCLGTAAALFPWHVYLHPDSYGPPRMTFSRGGVIPEEEIVAQSPRGPVRETDTSDRVASRLPRQVLDPVTTGKVDRTQVRTVEPEQPFPEAIKTFKVLAVDGARALVGDAGGVYLVRAMSRLPDGSIAEAFRQDEKGWYIVTSRETILRPD
ncbi:hypothetical protein [Oricola indica]|jgi:hypothetical protein|uniref:hypothetical protein n=1 Tax=Oricola indica TaxID=2872591 RepID=UPI001CBCF77F|nr:hypothetical protein [Oricola indica]